MHLNALVGAKDLRVPILAVDCGTDEPGVWLDAKGRLGICPALGSARHFIPLVEFVIADGKSEY